MPLTAFSSERGSTKGVSDAWLAPANSLSPLVQRFLLGFRQWREKVADDAARASLDLDRHRHTRTEFDELVIHLHVRTVK